MSHPTLLRPTRLIFQPFRALSLIYRGLTAGLSMVVRVFLWALLLLTFLIALVREDARADQPGKTRPTTLRVATWNIANLHWQSGKPLRPWRDGRVRPRDVRNDADYQRLRRIVKDLNADIIALQEVGSPKAAARIFDPARWTVYLSSRYQQNNGDNPGAAGDIYTGFAVRKGVKIDRVETLSHFAAIANDGRRTRTAMALTMTMAGAKITLLSVHLKSGCFKDPLSTKAWVNRACPTLAGQIARLEQWIDDKVRRKQAYLVLGDFNRRIDLLRDRSDGVFQQLNDGDPKGVNIRYYPFYKKHRPYYSKCWSRNRALYHRYPIDYILLGARIRDLTQKRRRFTEVDLSRYGKERRYKGRRGARLSDHCPLVLTLRFRPQQR